MRRGRAIAVAWAVGLALAGPAGCGRDAPGGPPAAEAVSAAEDAALGVSLTVGVDRAAVRTVDRVAVSIETTRPAGMAVGVDEPDWAAAGWAVVGRAADPARAMADGRIAERVVVTLEPFLEGSYEVPPVVVSAGDRSLASGALAVEVTSVLEDGADAALAEPLPVRVPGTASPTGSGWGLVGVVLALAAVLLGLGLARRRGGDGDAGDESPESALRRVAAGRAADEAGTWRTVHRAVETLAPGRPALARLAERCERARFAPAGPGSGADAVAIAREALGVLENGEGLA